MLRCDQRQRARPFLLRTQNLALEEVFRGRPAQIRIEQWPVLPVLPAAVIHQPIRQLIEHRQHRHLDLAVTNLQRHFEFGRKHP